MLSVLQGFERLEPVNNVFSFELPVGGETIYFVGLLLIFLSLKEVLLHSL